MHPEGKRSSDASTRPGVTRDAAPAAQPRERSLSRNIKCVSKILYAYLGWLLFTAFFVSFIYYILIQGKVEIVPGFVLEASTTNLLISIFSQLFVILAVHTISSVLAALRVSLAINGGMSLAAFLGTGEASGWFSTFYLFAAAWVPQISRRFTVPKLAEGSFFLMILLEPLIALGLGSVLKFKATFAYYFLPGPVKLPVYAGLIPIPSVVLKFIQPALVCLFFNSWTASLLTNNKYAATYPMDSCTEDCRSIILPGGIETSRLALNDTPTLQFSTLWGDFFNGTETMTIEDAPGTVLVFRQLPGGFAFDVARDCLFTGQTLNDTLKMCIQQDGPSVIAGWSACPDTLYESNNCSSTQSWATGPVKWVTNMTVYRQFVTTAYNMQNFSIINVQPTRPAVLFPADATEYMILWKQILVPPAPSAYGSNVADVSAVQSLVYLLGWFVRTYEETFPNDQSSPITYLHNWMAIPQQFSVTAVQYVNYTTSVGFSLPEDLLTSAIGGVSKTRLIIQIWTGWVFIGVAILLLVLVAGGILFVVLQIEPLPYATGIPEIDSQQFVRDMRVRRAAKTRRYDQGGGADDSTHFSDFAKFVDVKDKESTWVVARKVSRWQVYNEAARVGEDAYPGSAG